MLFALAVIYIGYKLIKEACEPELPASYHGNTKLEEEDVNKVRFGQMSRSEYLRNMNRGKYYAPPKVNNNNDK